MKKAYHVAAAFAVVLIAMVAVLGCSKKAEEKTAEGGKLYIYNWTYYTPDSVIEKFEKEYGVDVIYDSFASTRRCSRRSRPAVPATTWCSPRATTSPS
jgi:spermidine/putrescine transport system substrate-binding protein